MKTTQFKLSALSLLLLAGFAFSNFGNKDSKSETDSKSSADVTVYKDSDSPGDNNSSYHTPVAEKDYSNSWKSEKPH